LVLRPGAGGTGGEVSLCHANPGQAYYVTNMITGAAQVGVGSACGVSVGYAPGGGGGCHHAHVNCLGNAYLS
jgi:hypothetical protein